MTWARIENSLVMETTSTDPAGLFHPDLIWQAVPTDLAPWVTQGWTFDGTDFVPTDLDQFKTNVSAKAKAWSKALRGAIAGTNDMIEVASWSSKEQAAMRHLAGAPTLEDTNALGIEAALRGEPVDDLATLISLRAAQFRAAEATIIGLTKQFETALAAAQDAPVAIAAFTTLTTAPEITAITGDTP